MTLLVDTDLLVYAVCRQFPQHPASLSWFTSTVNSGQRIGLPWQSLVGFARVVTHHRVLARPLSADQAWGEIRQWIALPNVHMPEPGARHADILGRLLLESQATGTLIPDAHLAALAIEHGLRLCSADGDFARFRGLQWENPLLP